MYLLDRGNGGSRSDNGDMDMTASTLYIADMTYVLYMRNDVSTIYRRIWDMMDLDQTMEIWTCIISMSHTWNQQLYSSPGGNTHTHLTNIHTHVAIHTSQ